MSWLFLLLIRGQFIRLTLKLQIVAVGGGAKSHSWDLGGTVDVHEEVLLPLSGSSSTFWAVRTLIVAKKMPTNRPIMRA
jgi:hypothetical protein